MAQSRTHPVFQRALTQHLGPVKGLLGCNAFLKRDMAWIEASRMGVTDADLVEDILTAFDPKGGGAVQALSAGPAAWLATYSFAGPGLDLCILFFLDGISPSELQSQLELIESKIGWLTIAALMDYSEIGENAALSTEIGAMVLLDAANARTLRQLADQWIARLEKSLSPDLLAVNWVRDDKPKLAAVSGGAMIDRNSQARTDIEALSEIAIRSRAPILLETTVVEPISSLISDEDIPDPEALSEAESAMARVEALDGVKGMALPIYDGDHCRAVVVAIWKQPTAILPRIEGAELVAQVLGEAMTIQTRAHPSILRKLVNWLGGLLRAIFGKRAAKLKLLVVGIAAALVVLSFVPSNYQPNFSARIEARDRLVVSAPFDGFLSEAPFQLGDQVEAGALMIAMEDTDFRLEFSRVQAEQQQLETEAQAARATRDTARVRTLEAQLEQVGVELALLEQQLELAQYHALGRSVVIGGDAWSRVGGRVRLGEPLLELAAPDSFRVLAFLDEDWVADIAAGTTGTVLLTAYPQSPLSVSLTTVTTDAQPRDGVNTFGAWFEVEIEGNVTVLDGMRGIVRLEVPQTSVLAAYSRGPMRWFRRTLWRWS
jgi:hypothetical protein